MDSSEQQCREALVRILGSLYPDGDHLLCSFLYGAPGTPMQLRRIGGHVFVRERQFIEALVFLRRNGARHLRDMSISALHSIIVSFLSEHFYYISNGRLLLEPGVSFAEQTSPEGLAALTRALLRYSIFSPANEVAIYPLATVTVENEFQSRHLAFTAPEGLAASLDQFGVRNLSLRPMQFPPFVDFQLPGSPAHSWLCISSPDSLIARKLACATLGALALTHIRKERYFHTGRSVHDGFCTVVNGAPSYTSGSPAMTPPIGSNIVLTQADKPWLEELSTLFDREEHSQRAHVRALEYFHRAWFDKPSERFPTLCMALDSLVGARMGHTKAAVDFVVSTIGEPIDRERLKMLLQLRGAVVHGAAPDVYESQFYDLYYAEYLEDPIADLELVVARCLRQDIFRGKLQTHADPHADAIRLAQASGILPRNMRGRSIIADE